MTFMTKYELLTTYAYIRIVLEEQGVLDGARALQLQDSSNIRAPKATEIPRLDHLLLKGNATGSYGAKLQGNGDTWVNVEVPLKAGSRLDPELAGKQEELKALEVKLQATQSLDGRRSLKGQIASLSEHIVVLQRQTQFNQLLQGFSTEDQKTWQRKWKAANDEQNKGRILEEMIGQTQFNQLLQGFSTEDQKTWQRKWKAANDEQNKGRILEEMIAKKEANQQQKQQPQKQQKEADLRFSRFIEKEGNRKLLATYLTTVSSGKEQVGDDEESLTARYAGVDNKDFIDHFIVSARIGKLLGQPQTLERLRYQVLKAGTMTGRAFDQAVVRALLREFTDYRCSEVLNNSRYRRTSSDITKIKAWLKAADRIEAKNSFLQSKETRFLEWIPRSQFSDAISEARLIIVGATVEEIFEKYPEEEARNGELDKAGGELRNDESRGLFDTLVGEAKIKKAAAKAEAAAEQAKAQEQVKDRLRRGIYYVKPAEKVKECPHCTFDNLLTNDKCGVCGESVAEVVAKPARAANRTSRTGKGN